MHDGSRLTYEVHGSGPNLLLPVDPTPAEGEQAEAVRAWGMDPALGRSLIDGLSDSFRVIAVDYQGHVLANPKPDTLTPDTMAADLLAVANAAGASEFAYYGYSWLALAGLQLAARTDRLTALAMGGFPALGAPYAEMLAVTTATYELALDGAENDRKPLPANESASRTDDPAASVAAPESAADVDWSTVEVTMSPEQTKQFVTYYSALRGFDDRAVQTRIRVPRLCFAGELDDIDYAERWGGVRVRIGAAVTDHRSELEALDWSVRVLDGLDHMAAMQPGAVLPVLRPWLIEWAG